MVSIALCLIVLGGLIPETHEHVHAWDEFVYCEYCGEGCGDDWVCPGGDHCGRESGRDCYEENHCPDCGECYEHVDFCEECGICSNCAKDVGWCGNCHVCGNCAVACYTIVVETNHTSNDEQGYVKAFIPCGSADDPRPIKLRQRGSAGKWFLWEQYLLTGVRTPKAADPWA